MELRKPRPKKARKFEKAQPLPRTKVPAIFDGFSVIIEEREAMKCIYENGFFGKANLSRSHPAHHQNQIIRRRQYEKRKKWEDKSKKNLKIKKVIVVPDSDSDDENYFTSLKPEYQIDRSEIGEKLCLSLAEAYYLAQNIHVLNIYDGDVNLNEGNMWKSFSENDANFAPNYLAYCHFRKKGWIVKSALKFGGDYLLYKLGPPYYHASYVVIIDVVDEELCRVPNLQRRSMEMVNMIGLNRLCEAAGKELLICQIVWPKDWSHTNDVDLQRINIIEILMRRWVATQDNL